MRWYDPFGCCQVASQMISSTDPTGPDRSEHGLLGVKFRIFQVNCSYIRTSKWVSNFNHFWNKLEIFMEVWFLLGSFCLMTLVVTDSETVSHVLVSGIFWHLTKLFFFLPHPLAITNQVVVQLGCYNQILCGRWKATSVTKNRFLHQLQLACIGGGVLHRHCIDFCPKCIDGT